MKTKNILIVIAIVVTNLVSIGRAYAADRTTDSVSELDKINSAIEKTIKFEAPKVEVNSESDSDNLQLTADQFDRETLENLTMVPWMIREVVVRPMKKNVKNVNDCEVTVCLAK
jgi:hypothetical protein